MRKIIVSAILSYMLGCVHLAHYFGKKVKNIDIRTTGSHNSGTANAIMV
ncbi:MAG: glycerol-3-phosphate acyltransferase, partial [Solobacterium sp.]|nr:glycerol-3-phosphate acyltransferase [Solobacterium sp.]